MPNYILWPASLASARQSLSDLGSSCRFMIIALILIAHGFCADLGLNRISLILVSGPGASQLMGAPESQGRAGYQRAWIEQTARLIWAAINSIGEAARTACSFLCGQHVELHYGA